jgi:hypothetical protein
MGISQLTRGWVRKAGFAFRRRRMHNLCVLLGVNEATRILDVGGTPLNWTLLDIRPRVTLLNIRPEHQAGSGTFEYVSADARQLPFGDGTFDVVFSNSVIEHVGTPGEQRRFADEVRRVGQRYWVQMPNRWYPIETHLLTPLLHFLPMKLQRPLAWRWTLWDWIERPSPDRREFYIEHYLNTVRLLEAAELKALFHGGRLLRERHLGITKSLIVAKSA